MTGVAFLRIYTRLMFERGPKSAFASTLVPVLALVLTAQTLWLPVAEGIHQVTATHAHRYCSEHGVFERVEQNPEVSGNANAATVADGHAVLGTGSPTSNRFDPHIACPLANVHSQRTPACTCQEPSAPSPPQRSLGTTQQKTSTNPLGILALAPKQSPPQSLRSL